MAEFAIVAPLLILVVFFALYLGLTYSAKNLAHKSVDDALRLATVNPDIMIPEQCATGTQSQECAQAIAKRNIAVQSLANMMRESTAPLVRDGAIGGLYTIPANYTVDIGGVPVQRENPLIELPEIDAVNKSLFQAFENVPIKATVRVDVNFPLMPSTFFEVKTARFYETHGPHSNPQLFDCHGNPAGSPAYYATPCDCSSVPNSVWSPSQRRCIPCPAPTVANWQVGYQPNKTTIPGTDIKCHFPQEDTCEALGGEIAYTGPYLGNCTCFLHDTGNSYVLQPGEACSCTSDPDFQPPDYGSHQFTGVGQGDAGFCQCQPQISTEEQCDALVPQLAGLVAPRLDGCGCRCKCSGPQTYVGADAQPPACDDCRCPGAPVWDPEAQRCTCVNIIPCNPPQQYNEAQCLCTCPPPSTGVSNWGCGDFEFNQATCACNCPPGWSHPIEGYGCVPPDGEQEIGG